MEAIPRVYMGIPEVTWQRMKVHTWGQDSMGHVCQGDIGPVLWDYKCLIVHFQYSVKQDSIKDICRSQGQHSGLKINDLQYIKGNFFFS